MKKAQFEEIYASAFSDPTRWRRWFVDEVVTDTADDDIFIVPDSAGRPSASALMKTYGFMYRGVCLPSGYISCVATKPEARTRGLASIAVQEALSEAVRRGYAFCELIPANRSLYSFYCRFGLPMAFYADEERYTSLHEFSDGIGEAIEPTYAVFHGLEERLGCSIIHSETDYRRIIKDLSFESGHSVAFVREGGYACLFASWDAGRDDATVTVRSLLADSEPLAMGALGVLRAEVGERPFTVLRPPLSGEKAHLRVRAWRVWSILCWFCRPWRRLSPRLEPPYGYPIIFLRKIQGITSFPTENAGEVRGSKDMWILMFLSMCLHLSCSAPRKPAKSLGCPPAGHTWP